jgi:beta-glucosidase
MLSHASAASVLRSLYPNSTLSIISDSAYLIPNTTSSEDIAASERYLIWHLGSYFEPLITGDWPPEMRAADPSGVRLPFFSPDESKLMKNSVAYLGLDFYTTMLVSSSSPNNCPPNSTDGFESDLCVTIFCGNDKRCPPNPNPNPHMSWLHYEPTGLRKTLSWMSKRWPTLPLLIAENGVGLDGGSNGDPTSSGDFLIDTNDQAKIDVLSGFWEQAWLSINEDNVDLRGIFVWSFLDNLEWDSGYSAHFGLVHVNHSRVDLQRTPKLSALWYQKVIQENGFEMPSRLA